MRVQTHVKNLGRAAEVRRFAQERAAKALARFRERVPNVLVQVRDMNGPRGGVDMSCRVLATVRPGMQLFVEERRASPFAAIDGALDRLTHLVRDRIKHARARRRKR